MNVPSGYALVGSSNFTKAGLTQNIELNVQVKDEVEQLQKWFEEHWQNGVDITEAVLKVMETHCREFSPYDVYLRSMYEYFRSHEETVSEWEENESVVYKGLSQYQKDGYNSLIQIAERYSGAFLCDGVGLGKDMENGIHEISSEMYKDYNNARGIRSNGIKHDGQIYVIKRNDLYMFLLKSNTSLCILSGGRRKRLDNNDLNYYYENMETYAQRVKEAVSPYQKALRGIAREICRIGGWGNVHGCIVDIDFFNHIYLNPHDGKITPYFATDISSRIVYDDLPSLLDANMPELKKIFDSAYKKGNIPLLSQYAVAQNEIKNMAVAKVPQLVCGTEIYESSRIMMSIQYIFDNNTIRIWSDDILNADFGKNLPILTIDNQSGE